MERSKYATVTTSGIESESKRGAATWMTTEIKSICQNTVPGGVPDGSARSNGYGYGVPLFRRSMGMIGFVLLLLPTYAHLTSQPCRSMKLVIGKSVHPFPTGSCPAFNSTCCRPNLNPASHRITCDGDLT